MLRSRCLRDRCGGPHEDLTVADNGPPRCANCTRIVRPDVVLFGEKLNPKLIHHVETTLRGADLCLYVGTSGEVWPVSDLVSVARNAGARCVLVNKDPWRYEHPDFHETHLGPAEELLGELFA